MLDVIFCAALAVSEPEDQPSPSAADSTAGSELSTELGSATQAQASLTTEPSEAMLLLESPQVGWPEDHFL